MMPLVEVHGVLPVTGDAPCTNPCTTPHVQSKGDNINATQQTECYICG